MPIFTLDILNQGKSRNGFWSNKQIYALGLSEIKKGWKNEVIGKELSIDNINKFLDLKNKHLNNNNNNNNNLSRGLLPLLVAGVVYARK